MSKILLNLAFHLNLLLIPLLPNCQNQSTASINSDRTLNLINTGMTFPEWCSISPDGQWLSFTDNSGNLSLQNLVTGKIKRLTSTADWLKGGHAMWARFSKNGKQIAYYWTEAKPGLSDEIRIIGIDGKEYRSLVKNPGRWTILSDWSPDSMEFLATRDKDILLISAIDGNINIIPGVRAAGQPVFSPDNKWIVHDRLQDDSSGNYDIWIMSRDGGNARPLITNHSNDAIIGWSRRGTLFFKSNRGGQTGLWKTEIRENKITQASKKAMPEFEGFSNAIGVTDYNSIAFSIANNNIDIYPGTFDAATKKAIWDTEPIAQHTTGSNSYPHWSPDGKSFLYLSSPSVGSRKVIVHDSSGNEKEIIPALAWFNRPQYHPSGQIIVTGGEVSGSEGIYAFDIFSNKPSQLIDTKLNETRFHGQWSKDGITYYNRYSDAFKGEYKLNKTIGEKTTLYSPPAGWLTQGGLLSPDERTLGLGIAHPEKGQKIILVDTKTGASKDLISKETYQSLISFPCCRPWTWTPDSKHILIAVNEENENSKLIQVSTEDGSITPLLSGKGITNPHLNADGKRLLVQMGTIENEIWLLLEKKVDKSKKTDLH